MFDLVGSESSAAASLFAVESEAWFGVHIITCTCMYSCRHTTLGLSHCRYHMYYT